MPDDYQVDWRVRVRRNHDICLGDPHVTSVTSEKFEVLLCAGVDVACMAMRCFEKESSDTIIYYFCAGFETVKDAVVKPEVGTPSTLVSPCANSSIRVPLSCWSPSSHFLASGSEDLSGKPVEKVVFQLPNDRQVSYVSFSSDGSAQLLCNFDNVSSSTSLLVAPFSLHPVSLMVACA